MGWKINAIDQGGVLVVAVADEEGVAFHLWVTLTAKTRKREKGRDVVPIYHEATGLRLRLIGVLFAEGCGLKLFDTIFVFKRSNNAIDLFL